MIEVPSKKVENWVLPDMPGYYPVCCYNYYTFNNMLLSSMAHALGIDRSIYVSIKSL